MGVFNNDSNIVNYTDSAVPFSCAALNLCNVACNRLFLFGISTLTVGALSNK